MIPVLYDQGESLFLTNGLGRMTEATSCIVTEERNGVYELEMVYPVTGKHFGDIQTGRILTARHSDNINPQPFRIYRISRPLSGLVTINARHISYDLCDITVLPFTASGIQGTFAAIPNSTIVQCPFTFWTDKTTANTYSLTAPRSVRSMLGGEEGSILDIFGGGDYEFDRWAVKLHNRRGADNGVTIRYGKNLTDINRTTDAEDAYTAVVPFYVGADGAVVMLPEKMLTISGTATQSGTYTDHTGQIYTNDGGNNYTGVYTPTRILTLDLSEEWEAAPTVAQLRSKAQNYITNNLAGGPEDNVRVSFVALWQTEEYKDVAPLQRAEMGDTVHVYYPALDVNVSMRVIKTVYDCLQERYNSIELGTATYTMNRTIKGISSTVAESAAKAAAARAATSANSLVEKQTALITGQTGGYFVTDTDEAGRPIGWLLMDTPDKTTARNVIRANQSGIGFSLNGYNGPFVSAWTIDGSFNADFIRAGAINADLITTGGMSADRITSGTIDAARLNLTEYAKFTDLSTAGSTTINGSNITTGTLNADLITTGGMSAARITSGTIDAARLNLTEYAKFTDLSTSGNTTINGSNITTGLITDAAGKFSLNMTTGALTMQDGTFTGTVNATGGTIGGFSADADKLEYEETATTYGLIIKPSGASGTVLSFTRSDWQIISDGSFGIASGGYYFGQRYTGGSFYAGNSYFTYNGLVLYNAYTQYTSGILVRASGGISLFTNDQNGVFDVAAPITCSGAITSNGTDVLTVKAGEVIAIHSGVGGVWPATCVSSGKTIRIGVDLPRVVTGRSVTVSDWSGLYLKQSAGSAIYYGTTNMNNLSALPTGVSMSATVRGYNRVEIEITGSNAFVTASNGTTAITDRQTIQAMFTRLALSFS